MQQPFFNPFRPHLPNQNQSTTNTNAPPPLPQMFSSNPQQNPMSMQQPQFGLNMVAPHIPAPFNATHFVNNGQAMPNLPPFMPTHQQQQQQLPPGFVNPQNNLMGMFQMLQSFMGGTPQNQASNLNALSMLMNQMNACQQQGQSFAPNPNNMPQQFCPNMGFPNLQNTNPPMPVNMANLASFGGPLNGNQALGNFPNQFQNMNPSAPVQMPNPASLNGPLSGNQALGPQHPNFLANSMHSCTQQVHSNQNGSMPLPVATQQVQGNSPALQRNQSPQPSALNKQQGNAGKYGPCSTSNPNWKAMTGKNFKRNPKTGTPQSGYQKSQFRPMHNGKRKFGASNEFKGEGYGHEMAAKRWPTNPANREEKRSRALRYTEDEIKQWVNDRRKHYPTEANIKKKQDKTIRDLEDIDREFKLRREQLKEILAKQAELGVEVAEIPRRYLSDSRKQGHDTENNKGHVNNRGRFQNKFDKRGRFNKKEQIHKEETSGDRNLSKREPTLLQKLLSKDIRADKHRLLQVFRFVGVNSFFKDWPEKPLEYPKVIIAEDGCKDEILKEKSLLDGEDVSKLLSETTAKQLGYACDSDEDEDGGDDKRASHEMHKNENNFQVEEKSHNPMGKCNLVAEVSISEEEEGEIIDEDCCTPLC
ncbi:hypothetical protein Tsubulata_019852 [Turnera subulata]|uniref:FMR1-interacting protein 1 conserved domain-containing protein n=1 Tax=Turnera subulata TaxID=218843 RepID=A0A9Q0IVY2_9ROSI|nr:hypothetical protein Tsubulata_019852 [Turnera subulata]